MLIDKEEIDNPATHTRCRCGITYFHLDENPCLACECEFYKEYQRHRFGDEDDFEQSDSTDRSTIDACSSGDFTHKR